MLCAPNWPAVVELCKEVTTSRARDRGINFSKYGTLPSKDSNFRHETLSLRLKLGNWLYTCQPKQGSHCISLFLGTLPLQTHFWTCFRAWSAFCAFTKKLLLLSDSVLLSFVSTLGFKKQFSGEGKFETSPGSIVAPCCFEYYQDSIQCRAS